jgi:hypothetical protein
MLILFLITIIILLGRTKVMVQTIKSPMLTLQEPQIIMATTMEPAMVIAKLLRQPSNPLPLLKPRRTILLPK